MRTIASSEIDEEGLVFVRNNTLVGYTTCVITDQPFDAVGLYFTDTITGTKKIRYLLINTMTGMRISSTDDYGPEISDLVNSMNVMSIATCKLKPVLNDDDTVNETETQKRRDEFRIHITNIVDADTRGWADYVRRLFGKKLAKSGSKYNSVDIINIIVKLMLGDFITDWTSTNVAVDPRTVETFSDAVSTEATPFLQGEVSDADEYNLPLQGFLHSNNLFGELTYITRPHTEEELSEYFVTSAKTDTNFKTALSYFEEFFRTDDEFLTAVLNGMQVRLDRKYTVKDMLRTNLISSSPYLVDYLRTLNPASVQYSNLLAQIITNEMVTGESFRS